MILTSLLIFSLLAFIGLAIDAGNLFRAQLAAQNSADATALAIVSHISTSGRMNVEREAQLVAGTEPIDDSARKAQMESHLANMIIRLARTNMSAAGFPHEPNRMRPVNVSSEYFLNSQVNPSRQQNTAFEYRVTVSRDVDYLIMGALPFIGRKYSRVTATASSVREIANLALVIDASGSIQCPNTGSCECLAAGTCPVDSRRRFESLVNSVVEFLTLFDLENDRINITAFNLASKTRSIQEMRAFLGNAGRVTPEEVRILGQWLINSWTPNSASNLCDGLLDAYAGMKSRVSNEKTTYIVLTDGAVTAGRFLFSAGAAKNSLGIRPEGGTGLGNYDYSLYSIDWKVPTREGVTTFTGPSLLTHYDTLVDWESEDNLGVYLTDPAIRPQLSIGTAPECRDSLARALEVRADEEVIQVAESTLSPCLRSMESHPPGNPARTYGKQYVSGDEDPRYNDWRRMYYHCAIEAADQLRIGEGATFYVLGIGETNPAVPLTDAYGLIDDISGRKDVFLNRLALDYRGSALYSVDDGTGVPRPIRFDYEEYRDYSDMPAEGRIRGGQYLPTQDAAEIRLLFQKIANKVLLKLVS